MLVCLHVQSTEHKAPDEFTVILIAGGKTPEYSIGIKLAQVSGIYGIYLWFYSQVGVSELSCYQHFQSNLKYQVNYATSSKRC